MRFSLHTFAPAAVGAAILSTPAFADTGAQPSSAPSLLDIVTHTPAWAWLVLVALVWLGLQRTRPRDVGVARLVLMPAILVALSLSNLLLGGLSIGVIAGLGLGGLLGAAAGFALERLQPARPLGNGRIWLPGEWTSLVVVLAVFVVRYVRAVAASVDPVLAGSDAFVVPMTGLSGFFALMLITRTVLRLRVALTAVPTQLKAA